MVILCNGMVRSGSTWSFNVAMQLVKVCDPHRETFGFYDENPAVLSAAVRRRDSHLVIKSHKLDPSNHTLCREGAVKTIYTWRSPYDAVISCARMFGQPVEHYLPVLRDALRVWSFHRANGTACTISYESIRHQPQESIRQIAAYLGLRPDRWQVSQIGEATSIERVRSFCQHLDSLDESRVVRKNGLIYDRRTLLHQNHVRDGRIGYGFAALNPGQLEAIDAILREENFASLCAAEELTCAV